MGEVRVLGLVIGLNMSSVRNKNVRLNEVCYPFAFCILHSTPFPHTHLENEYTMKHNQSFHILRTETLLWVENARFSTKKKREEK
jgi:hypothetical protein